MYLIQIWKRCIALTAIGKDVFAYPYRKGASSLLLLEGTYYPYPYRKGRITLISIGSNVLPILLLEGTYAPYPY